MDSVMTYKEVAELYLRQPSKKHNEKQKGCKDIVNEMIERWGDLPSMVLCQCCRSLHGD